MVLHVPLGLHAPKDEPLLRSPLRLVVFQLRHTPVDRREVGLGISTQDRLGGPSVWRLEPVQSQTVTIAAGAERPGQPGVEYQHLGWRLTAENQGAVITLGGDAISLETTSYPGWHAFRQVIDAMLSSSGVGTPAAETRLGLRYINRVEDPAVSNPGEWADWIDPSVLGIVHHAIGPNLVAAQQQLEVRIGDGIKATVQHGFLRDQASGRYPYLMDFDAFRDSARPFDLADVQATVDLLHSSVLSMFQSMITPRLYEYFLNAGDRT